MSTTGVWRTLVGTSQPANFYIREVGSYVWWLAESVDGSWANVFRGLRSPPDERTFSGEWASIPKGMSQGSGTIEVTLPPELNPDLLVSVGEAGDVLEAIKEFIPPEKEQSSGPFSKSEEQEIVSTAGGVQSILPQNVLTIRTQTGDPFPTGLLIKTSVPYVSAQDHGDRFQEVDARYVEDDLTGHWMSPDGGSYYLRQLGSTVWLMGDYSTGLGRSVVARGQAGEGLNLEWVDVPKGNQNGRGEGLAFSLWRQGADNTPQVLQVIETALGELEHFPATELIRTDANTVLSMGLVRVECIHETSGSSDDEIYFVLLGADLTTFPPRMEVRYAGVWDMNEDESDVVDNGLIPLEKVWGLPIQNGEIQPEPIGQPQDVIILAACIENDIGDPAFIRDTVRALAFAQLTTAITAGSDRAGIVSSLTSSVEGTLGGQSQIPLNLGDDLIDVDEIALTTTDLRKVWRGQDIFKTSHFQGGEAHYLATLRLYRGLIT